VPADKLQITLADRELVVEAGTTAGQALSEGQAADSARGTGPGTVIAARVNGELRDLPCPLADGDAVEPVPLGSPDGLASLNGARDGPGGAGSVP
jgi:threonyl-tRNA synthetase